MRKRTLYFLTIAVLFSGANIFVSNILSQTKPFTLGQILIAIVKINDSSGATKKELYSKILNDIRQRKVNFPFTKENEELLRNEGATAELIEVIRANSPSLSKPTPIKTPVSTPTPIPNFPTPNPTPTPTPKTDSSNITAGTVRKTTLPGGVEISFAFVPAGSFEMGSTQSDDEKPIHTVKISLGFWMQTTEVTQGQWKAVMGALPSKCGFGSLSGNFLGDTKPIICVSWDDAQEFVRQMNLKSDGYKYRLPTEAEWEYAARSGTTGNYAGNIDALAWYGGNSGGSTHDVATKQANAWGLYDMHGNVWEWCQDWYDGGYYAKSPASDPVGPSVGSNRVFRGGGWGNAAGYLRSAYRVSYAPSLRSRYLGFRLLRQ